MLKGFVMIKLTNRLMAIAKEVKPCNTVVDIGTDHGYIPVYLVQNNICENAIACDVNIGPLKSCKFLVESLSLEDKIKCVLSDGFENIKGNFDCAVMAGMGGELISDILTKSNMDNLKNCNLVINPMTHSEHVRKWLYTNGFSIDNDVVIPDLKHHYNIISAHFTGEYISPDNVRIFLGEIKDYNDREYFLHLKNYLLSKQKSGIDYSDVINAIEVRI